MNAMIRIVSVIRRHGFNCALLLAMGTYGYPIKALIHIERLGIFGSFFPVPYKQIAGLLREAADFIDKNTSH